MREIKFRVWDKQKKFMIKTVAIQNLTYKFASNKDHIFLQYIGLEDKNGEEIYEGDVLIDCEGEKWFVFYDNTCGWYRLKSCYNDEVIEDIPDNLTSDNKLDMKIIGSIYENPELLEGEINEI